MATKDPTKYEPQSTPVGEISRTKQSMQEDCDINLIVKRHAQTGMWDHLNPIAPTYGDFTAAVDLQAAMAAADQAERQFMQLPAEVRAAAQNSPIELLNMLADEDGYQALVKAGLPVEPSPKDSEPLPEPAPEPKPPAEAEDSGSGSPSPSP